VTVIQMSINDDDDIEFDVKCKFGSTFVWVVEKFPTLNCN